MTEPTEPTAATTPAASAEDRAEHHARLHALVQDRKNPKSKNRASRWMHVTLDASLAEALLLARQELAVAESERDQAAKEAAAGDKRSGGMPPLPTVITDRVAAAQAAVDAAQAAADAVTVRMTFGALLFDDYDELEKQHPPRDADEEDAEKGFNRDTFPGVLMRASATKVHDLDGNLLDMETDDVIDGMSNGERIMACTVSNTVNVRVASVPSFGAS